MSAGQDSGGYNGYKNYETWNVSLWLDNDESNYGAVRQLARDCIMEYSDPEAIETEGSSRYEFENALRAYVEELPEAASVLEHASFIADLLGAALSEVDWRTIADNIYDEVKDES